MSSVKSAIGVSRAGGTNRMNPVSCAGVMFASLRASWAGNGLRCRASCAFRSIDETCLPAPPVRRESHYQGEGRGPLTAPC
jgi:hypothetical protein